MRVIHRHERLGISFVAVQLDRLIQGSYLEQVALVFRHSMSKQRTPATVDSSRPLTANQRIVVDHIMTTGDTVAVTADKLGKAPTNIYRTLRLPHVKKYLHELTLEHIGLLAPYAARTQGELLESDSDHVRAAVSDSILNRHLGKAVERKQIAVQGSINVVIDLS